MMIVMEEDMVDTRQVNCTIRLIGDYASDSLLEPLVELLEPFTGEV